MKYEKLGDLCEIRIGRTPDRSKQEYWGIGYPWVSISDMKSKFVSETKEQITDIAVNEKNCKIIKKGTLLLSFKLSIGKLAFAGTDLYSNEAIASLNLKSNQIFNEYLYYALKFIPFVGSNIAAKGKTLNSTSLKNLKIPIPETYEDQVRIANLLTQAENLIAKRKKSIEHLDELLKSTFLEMFGDPVRNEKGWDIVKIESLGTIQRGKSKHRPRNAPELLGGKYPLIQTGDVSNAGLYITSFSQTYSEIGLAQSKMWKKGTLCITIAANIAKTAILSFDSCFPDSIVGFIANEEVFAIYIHFLFGFFQKILEQNAPQAAQKNINLDTIRKLHIPKPSKKLIIQFAEIVEKVEKIKKKYEDSLQELENLYGSLSQRAFKGEL
jgi:type I restriction enzyme S subunit